MTLVWYDGQEGEVEPRELWDLLRTHGFVDGDYRVADAATRRRVDELAQDLFAEIQASAGERQYQNARREQSEREALEREAAEEAC